MANCTPDGFICEVSIGQHLPPPLGVRSPALWGTEAAIRSKFEPAAANIMLLPQQVAFRYHAVDQFIHFFRTLSGPVLKALAALGEKGGTGV